ncbi:MAG: diguanylate cyclase [Desulfobacteraceae bacterium]|jgi:diguanylate cyclase (GGDEF)-like protein
MKILIAEDDLTSRMMLDGILKKWGFSTILANDGEQAWDLMRSSEAPQIAILDWQMPAMSGVEVCRKLHQLDRPSPPYLILLTSRGEKKDIVTGLEAGANDYISKPYDNEELLARIRVGERMVKLQMELLELNRALLHESMHDPLTGILNRRAIIQTLEKEISRAKRDEKPLSIGLCDIDMFKRINDTYGHNIGDDVLCGFTKLVQNKLRNYDHFGRYGGEEFLIVLPGSTGTKEENLYERICRQISDNEIMTGKGGIAVTVSIGVAAYYGLESLQELLTVADIHLYKAKEHGRNRVVYG